MFRPIHAKVTLEPVSYAKETSQFVLGVAGVLTFMVVIGGLILVLGQ